jgi:MFS family permease
MGGFSGGGFYSIAPAYISEISDTRVRGTLGSTVVFACNVGLFWSYVCGEYFEYLTTPWLMIPGEFAKGFGEIVGKVSWSFQTTLF